MDGKTSNKNGSGGMYKPTGDLQGDTKPMPDKGTTTGVDDKYGANLGHSATNRIGSMNGTGSDGMEAA